MSEEEKVFAKKVLHEVLIRMDVVREFHNYNIGTGYSWAMADVRKIIFDVEKEYCDLGKEQ